MLTQRHCLLKLFMAMLSLGPRLGLAQNPLAACQASVEDQQFHSEVIRSAQPIELLRKRLEADPENLWIHGWLIENRQTPTGSLASEYKKKLDDHPGSALYLYLYGRSLVGANTAEAIRELDLATAADPKLPWSHFALMEVYSGSEAKDAGKLAEHLTAFSQLCPEVLSGYNFIRFVEDRDRRLELTARFRNAIERLSSTGIGTSYRRLWTDEFRSADPSKFDGLRAQVAKDLNRIKQFDPQNTEALREGYTLIGDTAAANALPKRQPPESDKNSFQGVLDSWIKAHPFPKNGATAEEIETFNKQQLAASKQWVKDWPNDASAWNWLLTSLSKVKGTSNEELEKAGDALLETLKKQPFRGIYLHPHQTIVAEIWSGRNIRLEDCLRLTEEAMDLIDHQPAVGLPKSLFTGGRIRTLFVEADVARKLKRFDKAHAAIGQMKSWGDENPGEFDRMSYLYFTQSARLAEAEGHRVDALSYYQKLYSRLPANGEERAHVAALWKETGGTDEGFKVWASVTEAKQAVATEASSWDEVHKSLAHVNALDLAGKTWTIADLKGKTTLMVLWATWCGPCRAELPEVQKLFEQTSERKDIQVVTVNTDENPGLVGPFLKQTQFTFPVILGKAVADQVDGQQGIPRTWIVDASGTVRMEQLGFNKADWPQELLKRLTELQ